jgi:hypothetical protein
MRCLDCHARVKQVQRSYEAALQTVNLVIAMVESDPDILYENDINIRDLRAIGQELHDAYFARMFAYFESSVRHYWRARVRDTKPSTEVLLNSLAGRRGIPQDTLDVVQEIRDFRNRLVHEELAVTKRFTIAEASKHLNTYLARLPLEW